jgi:hypothetical protein
MQKDTFWSDVHGADKPAKLSTPYRHWCLQGDEGLDADTKEAGIA